MKPMLFNTEMVMAILDGRKTVTRRLVKFKPGQNPLWSGYIPENTVLYGSNNIPVAKAPFKPDDIIYVRETWSDIPETAPGNLQYKASASGKDLEWFEENGWKWRPSIHMPKEVARLFLRVKSVRVERLQDITADGVSAEGIDNEKPCEDTEMMCEHCPLPDELKGVHCYGGNPVMCEGTHCVKAMEYWQEEFVGEFANLWDSTIKRADLETYGYDANPWVWVIEFERISKEEALKGGGINV